MNTEKIRKSLEANMEELKDNDKLNNQIIYGIAFNTGYSSKTVKSYIFGNVSDLEVAEKIIIAAKNILKTV